MKRRIFAGLMGVAVLLLALAGGAGAENSVAAHCVPVGAGDVRVLAEPTQIFEDGEEVGHGVVSVATDVEYILAGEGVAWRELDGSRSTSHGTLDWGDRWYQRGTLVPSFLWSPRAHTACPEPLPIGVAQDGPAAVAFRVGGRDLLLPVVLDRYVLPSDARVARWADDAVDAWWQTVGYAMPWPGAVVVQDGAIVGIASGAVERTGWVVQPITFK